MKIKVVLDSVNCGIIEIISGEKHFTEYHISDFDLSVSQIPKLSATFPIDESQKKLFELEKGDKISISFEDDKDIGNFITKFVGEINTQKINLNEDRTKTLKVEALSPFMRLQDVQINQEVISDYKSLKQILLRIMEIGNIWGDVVIDADVADNIEIGFIYEFPALSLLKQICFQRDLIFNFDRGDVLRISNWSTWYEMAKAKPQVITTDQIRSMEIQK